MSQLLVRIAKLSSSSIWKKQHGLCFSGLRSLSTAATPYLLFEPTKKEATTPSGEEVVESNVYDPRRDEIVIFPDQTLTKELLTSWKVGSSRGWVLSQNEVDSTLRLTNMFNPCASDSSRKVISLPPSEDRINRISLSASPDQEDCVVAALSVFSYLSLCRPGDSAWTPVVLPFLASQMIYSVRDEKFYLNSRQEYDGPTDLIDSSSGFPQVSMHQEFPFSNIPKSRVSRLKQLLSTTGMIEHIVESPSGESFIVHWYDEDMFLMMEEDEGTCYMEALCQSSIRIKPRGFMVFRQDPEQKISSYTEDIGDLCIFLGYNEAFCVSATEYPGLKPNSIYFASDLTGFGFYDLSSNTVHDVINPLPNSCCIRWLAPLQ